MSDVTPEVTQEQVQAAESAEQSALEDAQKTYMRKRVVLLRVQLDRANAELSVANETIRILRERLDEGADVKAPGDPSIH